MNRRALLGLCTAGALSATAGCSIEIGGYEFNAGESEGDGDGSDGSGSETGGAGAGGDDPGDADGGDDTGAEDGYPEPAFDEDCIGFDPENVELGQLEDGRFQLLDGDLALLVFDEFENAQQGRDVVQAYGFDRTCFVGRPEADMTYWTVGGAPPSTDDASVEGEDCIGFDPDDLEINELEDDVWQLLDGDLAVTSAETEENAERVRDVIQHYGFDMICFVGRPDAPMEYWLSTGE